MTATPSSSTPLPYTCSKPDDVPNRVCIDKESPYFWADYNKLGVKSQGVERPNDVVEFDVAGGWMRVFATVNGKPRVERGHFVTIKISRQFDVFYR